MEDFKKLIEHHKKMIGKPDNQYEVAEIQILEADCINLKAKLGSYQEISRQIDEYIANSKAELEAQQTISSNKLQSIPAEVDSYKKRQDALKKYYDCVSDGDSEQFPLLLLRESITLRLKETIEELKNFKIRTNNLVQRQKFLKELGDECEILKQESTSLMAPAN